MNWLDYFGLSWALTIFVIKLWIHVGGALTGYTNSYVKGHVGNMAVVILDTTVIIALVRVIFSLTK